MKTTIKNPKTKSILHERIRRIKTIKDSQKKSLTGAILLKNPSMEIDVEAEKVVVKEEIETVVFNPRRDVSISPTRKEGRVKIDQEGKIEEISPTKNEGMEMIDHQETIVETKEALAIGIADHKDEPEMIAEVGLSQTIEVKAQEIEI